MNDFKVGKSKLKQDFKCSYLWQRLIIQWDGEVFPCFYGDTLLDKGKGKDLLLGNANDISIHDIWHGQAMKQLRQLHSAGKFTCNKTCKDCGRQYDTYEDELPKDDWNGIGGVG